MMMDWVAVSVLSFPHDLCKRIFFFANVGCIDGFFDAGMLLKKLKIEEENSSKKDKGQSKRANVGKKLKIMEY